MTSRERKQAAALMSEARGRPLADLVLEYIWRQEAVSRAEIARRLGLSRSTVSEIVSSLLETGLVAEGDDGPSRGGRRPILIEFQDDAAAIVGVEMGASHVSVVLTDLRGRVLAWQNRDHSVRTDPEGTIALMVELVEACLDDWGGRPEKVMGIGVAVPSPVDPEMPDQLSKVVLPAWQGYNGMAELRARFGVPVFVDNDANLGAVAEQWWGGGRGIDDFTYIKVATGIGAGYVIRGEVYPGATSVAGEIGHLAIDPDGAPCVCGNRGCLTTVVGTPALVARAEALLADFPDSALAEGDITITAIEDAALANDALALQVVREAAENLGIAVAGVLNMLNPAAVIIGGGLSRLDERLLVPLRESVLTRTLVNSVAATAIRTSELGTRAIAIGAATRVLDAALTDPSLFPAGAPA